MPRHARSRQYGVAYRANRRLSAGSVGAAALRLSRLAAALTADVRGSNLDQLPGMNARFDEIVARRHQEAHGSIVDAGERDDPAAHSIAYRGAEVAQRFGIGLVHDRTDERAIAAAFRLVDVRRRFARRQPRAQLSERRLQILNVALHALHTFAQFFRRRRKRCGERTDQIALLARIFFGRLGNAGFDTANAAAD